MGSEPNLQTHVKMSGSSLKTEELKTAYFVMVFNSTTLSEMPTGILPTLRKRSLLLRCHRNKVAPHSE